MLRILHAFDEFLEVQEVAACFHHFIKEFTVDSQLWALWVGLQIYSAVAIHAECKCLLIEIKDTGRRYTLQKKQAFVDQISFRHCTLCRFGSILGFDKTASELRKLMLEALHFLGGHKRCFIDHEFIHFVIQMFIFPEVHDATFFLDIAFDFAFIDIWEEVYQKPLSLLFQDLFLLVQFLQCLVGLLR